MPADPAAMDEAELARLEGLRAKGTPGLWEVDTERNEDGEYGGGPDCGRGYDDFLIGATGPDGKWATLFGSENSTIKEIDEDYDEDYHRAWDRTAEANAALAAAAVNALPALIAFTRDLRQALEEKEQTWPNWAREIYEILREYGAVEPDESHLPDDLRTWIEGCDEEDKRLRARTLAAEARSARLAAALQEIRDKPYGVTGQMNVVEQFGQFRAHCGWVKRRAREALATEEG